MKIEGKILLPISKHLAEQLYEAGVNYKDGGISHSYSKHGKKYYLCTSPENMEILGKVKSGKMDELKSNKPKNNR